MEGTAVEGRLIVGQFTPRLKMDEALMWKESGYINYLLLVIFMDFQTVIDLCLGLWGQYV